MLNSLCEFRRSRDALVDLLERAHALEAWLRYAGRSRTSALFIAIRALATAPESASRRRDPQSGSSCRTAQPATQSIASCRCTAAADAASQCRIAQISCRRSRASRRADSRSIQPSPSARLAFRRAHRKRHARAHPRRHRPQLHALQAAQRRAPRSSSAWEIPRPSWFSSAKAPAATKTCRASPSSAAPENCSRR